MKKPNTDGSPIHCTCGKMIARVRGGKIFVYCKTCKREIPLPIVQEPRAKEAQSH